MSVTDQLNEARLDGSNNEPRLVLDLDLIEAQALRAWLLETELNGLSAQDTPVVSTALAKLGRAVDTAQATVNIAASSSRRASTWLTGPTSRCSSSAVASLRRLAPSWAAEPRRLRDGPRKATMPLLIGLVVGAIVGALVLGGGAVGVHEQVGVAVVGALERGARLDVDDPAGRHVHPLGRIP